MKLDCADYKDCSAITCDGCKEHLRKSGRPWLLMILLFIVLAGIIMVSLAMGQDWITSGGDMRYTNIYPTYKDTNSIGSLKNSIQTYHIQSIGDGEMVIAVDDTVGVTYKIWTFITKPGYRYKQNKIKSVEPNNKPAYLENKYICPVCGDHASSWTKRIPQTFYCGEHWWCFDWGKIEDTRIDSTLIKWRSAIIDSVCR